MQSFIVECAVLSALLLVNAIFSMSEMALVSARKVRLQQLAAGGSRGAAEALRLAESPARFLSIVQIGITLVGVLAGAFGGIALTKWLAEFLVSAFPVSEDAAQALGVTAVVTLITFLSVILGELVPKRLALKYPERVASLVAFPMSLIARVSWPVVWLFTAATELVLKALRLNGNPADANVTHEEIKAMVRLGVQEGLLGPQERTMMDRVLSFGTKRVTSIMTRTRDIIWIDSAKPLEHQIAKLLESHFSHYPVAHGSLDDLQGTVRAKDICRFLTRDKAEIATLLQRPLFIPDTAYALKVLELFKASSLQMGFVINEFGEIQGLLTLTDILEAIVGDFPNTGVPQDGPVRQRQDGSWLVDGALPIDALKERLGIDFHENPEEEHFRTLGGFVMYRLGRVPAPTDAFSWHGWRFEIVDMERKRIDKVLVSRVSRERFLQKEKR